MAGVAPPPDAPPPEEQGIVTADAGFAPSPTPTSICDIVFPPNFSFSFSINLPFPNFVLPTFNFALGLNCDLNDPIDAEVSFGGGRVPTGNFDAEDRDY